MNAALDLEIEFWQKATMCALCTSQRWSRGDRRRSGGTWFPPQARSSHNFPLICGYKKKIQRWTLLCICREDVWNRKGEKKIGWIMFSVYSWSFQHRSQAAVSSRLHRSHMSKGPICQRGWISPSAGSKDETNNGALLCFQLEN